MITKEDTLKVSEVFYSVQAEGPTLGMPAIFVRLAGCNFNCRWCDTAEVWKKGEDYNHMELAKMILDFKQDDNLIKRRTHLVWTGGEPSIQAKSLEKFLQHFMYFGTPSKNVQDLAIFHNMYNELETNGTAVGEDVYKLYMLMSQINCSPKLENSFITESKRIVPQAIKLIQMHSGHVFKFVISKEDDIKEMQETYIDRFALHPNRVMIMPAVDNRKDLPERTRFIFEMSKKYNYMSSMRAHILAWDKSTGV